MKSLDRIKVLEDQIALLKAELTNKEQKPVSIHQTLNFLVHPKKLGKMTWKNAKKACSDLGDGWRLPTRLELLIMYNDQDKIGGFANSYYWSSTENGNYDAWVQNFSNGSQYGNYKSTNYYVRAVRNTY
jgi:hypothetical protein